LALVVSVWLHFSSAPWSNGAEEEEEEEEEEEQLLVKHSTT
jgi:hypothetical protein